MLARLMSRFVAVLAVLATSGTAMAWEAPYVEQGIARGIEAAKALKDLSGFGARSDGVCLIGGFMETGGEITWKAKLTGGKEYFFVGAGDVDVEDLDLQAWEGDKMIAQDDKDDNVPLLLITAEGDAEVTLKMKLEVAPGDGQRHFNVLLMLENAGTGGKLSQLEGVAQLLNAAVEKVTDKGDLEFDQAPNTVCIAAGLLESGASKSFHRNFSKGNAYVMVGAGDDNCKDLDLEVLHEDKCVAKDEETDSTPVVAVAIGEENARCTVKMTMHESAKASFSVVAILIAK